MEATALKEETQKDSKEVQKEELSSNMSPFAATTESHDVTTNEKNTNTATMMDDEDNWGGNYTRLSKQVTGEGLDSDFFVMTVDEFVQVNENDWVLGGRDMVVDAATQLCVHKNQIVNDVLQDQIMQLPVYTLSHPCYLRSCIDYINTNPKDKACLFVICLPFGENKTLQVDGSELGYILSCALTDPKVSLDKALFVVLYDDNNDDNANNTNLDDQIDKSGAMLPFDFVGTSLNYNKDDDMKKGIMNILSSLMAGFISKANFVYWYTIANLDYEDLDALLNNSVFTFDDLCTPSALKARNNACQMRVKMLEALKK